MKDIDDTDFQPIAAWHDQQPLWHPFTAQQWRAQIVTLAGSLPADATLALAYDHEERVVMNDIRGTALTQGQIYNQFTYYARSDYRPHTGNLYLSSIDVHASINGRGIGGMLFAGQLAAAAEAEVPTASIQAARDGTYVWAAYGLQVDWEWDKEFVNEFATKLLKSLHKARKLRWITPDEHMDLVDAVALQDPEILQRVMNCKGLQEDANKYGITRARYKHILFEAGNWMSGFSLDGPIMDRIFGVVERKQSRKIAPMEARVAWRPGNPYRGTAAQPPRQRTVAP